MKVASEFLFYFLFFFLLTNPQANSSFDVFNSPCSCSKRFESSSLLLKRSDDLSLLMHEPSLGKTDLRRQNAIEVDLRNEFCDKFEQVEIEHSQHELKVLGTLALLVLGVITQ